MVTIALASDKADGIDFPSFTSYLRMLAFLVAVYSLVGALLIAVRTFDQVKAERLSFFLVNQCAIILSVVVVSAAGLFVCYLW